MAGQGVRIEKRIQLQVMRLEGDLRSMVMYCELVQVHQPHEGHEGLTWPRYPFFLGSAQTGRDFHA